MINYDRAYIMQRLLRTWRATHLEVVGVYEFYINDKAIIKLYKQTNSHCILELSTSDGEYSGMLEVTPKEYKDATKGKPYGKGTILRHTKDITYTVISKIPVPDEAIKSISRESKLHLSIFTLVALCSTAAALYMIYFMLVNVL